MVLGQDRARECHSQKKRWARQTSVTVLVPMVDSNINIRIYFQPIERSVADSVTNLQTITVMLAVLRNDCD